MRLQDKEVVLIRDTTIRSTTLRGVSELPATLPMVRLLLQGSVQAGIPSELWMERMLY